MGTKIFSAVLSAMILATASVGVTASAEEIEDMSDTAAVVEEVTESTDDTEDKPDNAAGAEQSDNDSSFSEDFSEDDSYDMEKYREIMNNLENAEGTEITADYENDPYYDTDGNATLIKSERIVYNSEEMQFIAVTTKDGHVFYVLINYSAENGEDNVYFLNRVDDYDLYALLYAGEEDEDGNAKYTPEEAMQAAQAANGRVQVDSTTAVTETEDSTDETAEGEQVTAKTNATNPNSIYLVFGAIALIGVGGAGYFFMKKKGGKSAVKETVDDDDEDDITFPDDENY